MAPFPVLSPSSDLFIMRLMEKTILDMAGFDAASVAVATTAAAQNKPFKMNPDVYKLLKDHEKGVERPKDEAMEDVKRVAVRHAMKEVSLRGSCMAVRCM